MSVSWKLGGLMLGLVFFAAMLLVKPIGMSTEFVVFDGVIWDMINPDIVFEGPDGPTSSNAYLNGVAKSVANPLNYGVVFVLATMLGAGVSAALRGAYGGGGVVPSLWAANFGASAAKRFAGAFLGGFIVLYGARLAGGCTSGHMMSGMSQTSVSGFIFAAGAFLVAIPTAMILFKQEG